MSNDDDEDAGTNGGLNDGLDAEDSRTTSSSSAKADGVGVVVEVVEVSLRLLKAEESAGADPWSLSFGTKINLKRMMIYSNSAKKYVKGTDVRLKFWIL